MWRCTLSGGRAVLSEACAGALHHYTRRETTHTNPSQASLCLASSLYVLSTTTPEGGGVRRTSGGGRPALSRGARVFSRGGPGVAATSGRSGGWRCPRWRPGKEEKIALFVLVGLFWLILAFLLVILPGRAVWFGFPNFFPDFPRGVSPPRTSGDQACRRARGDRHLGHVAPAGAPEVRPTPPPPGVVVRNTLVI